mgnify:CR=1 FL=1
MGVYEEIKAVANAPGDGATKRRTIRDLKANALHNIIKPKMPHRWYTGHKPFTIVSFNIGPRGEAVCWVDVIRNGRPINNPVVIVNPPLLVPDPSGDIVIKGRKFRYDPLTALQHVIEHVR